MAAHCADVDKKPHKVEEAQAIYAAKKPVNAYLPPKTSPDKEEFDRVAAKLLTERKELLHKLAQ